jgi:hypothetical protein
MEARAVRIYVQNDAPRLRYIAGIILSDMLGLPWEIVTDKRKLGKHPAINYSNEKIQGSFRICPDELLFETGIRAREISVTDWQGLPVFFQGNPDSDIPFDIFAASFYLISRYEEYLDHEPDEFGRFRASSSLAFRHGFLGIPLVDLWSKELARTLLRKFQSLTFRRNEYRAMLTIDTDQPFAYLGRNIFSSIGGLFRDLASSNGHPGDRYRIVVKGEKDPYEVFDYITENADKSETDTRFFFPVGDHTRYDRNPSWRNEEYRLLINKIACRYKTGLHPSYNASQNCELIKTESSRLKLITGFEITRSRFHSVRFFMPESFDALINAGITEDYSMGYPDEPGFRAGIARPYYFYNILRDEQTTLQIFPFQVMDSSLYNNKHLEPLRAKEVIMNLISETRRTGGTFASIWHNTSLLGNSAWQGWREVFEFMLKTQLQ